MFTPKKKKVKPEWGLRSHRPEPAGLVVPSPSPRSAERGKSPAIVAPPKFESIGIVDQEAQDWKSFKQAGLLDESLIQKQDHQALLDKVAHLQSELRKYQHEMGLILIKHENLTTDYEGLSQEFSNSQVRLKREQTAHLMALSEVEKREENLRRELENQKHFAVDDANGMGKHLEKKEKELLALEEKLIARERALNQKLYDEQNMKTHEVQHEMDRKMRVVDEELRNKVAEVEQMEVEALRKMGTVEKREQALEMKMGKYKEKERELEVERETLREREISLKAEEIKQEKEKKHILTEKENLRVSNDELDKKRLDIDNKQQQLHNKMHNLEVTEEEKRELQRLQSELGQKKDESMLQEKLFSKEQEALKQNKEKLEKEWKLLDKKKVEIESLRNQVNEDKEKFEKLKRSNEERLKNENLIAQEFIQSQLEALRSKKASFEATMERERLLLSEEVQTKHNEMLQEIELQKKELEIDMQNKLEEKEKNLLEKEKAMKEASEKELKDINHSKEEASKVIKDMSLEKLRVEKEMQEMAASKQFLEGQQIELRKEIDKLNLLVKKLKDQSKGFKEFLEKNEKCKNCGEHINGFAHFDLHFLQEMGNIEISPLLRLSADYTSGGIKDSEVSLHLGVSHLHPECDTNPRPGVNSANSVKTMDEDMEVIPNPELEQIEVKHPSAVPDVSACINEGKRNPRRGVKRANPVKVVDEATKVILDTTLEPIEGRHPSEIADVAVINEGKRVVNRRRGVRGAKSVRVEGTEGVLGTQEPTECKPSAITEISADIDGDNHANNPRHGVKRAKSIKAVDEDMEVIPATVVEHVQGEHPCGTDVISAMIDGNKRDVKPMRGVKRPKSVKAAEKDTDIMLGTILEPIEDTHPSRIPDISADVNENKHDADLKHGVTQAKSSKATENTVVLATAVESVKGKHITGTADVSADTRGGKRGINPRGGVKRAKSVKAVDEDATVIPATILEPVEGKVPNDLADVPADTNQGNCAIKPRRGAKRTNLGQTISEDKKILLGTNPSVSIDVSASINDDKPGIKPRRGGKRGNSVKAVVEDVVVVLNTTQVPIVDKNPSGITDASAGISRGSGEGPVDSQCMNKKPAAPLPSHVSGAATSEENHDSSELQSVSVSPSGSRKRRQTLTRGSKVSEETRYNLRRR